MSKEHNKVLKYNHGQNSIKVQFIIYADMEYLLEKMRTCHNNLKHSLTTKISKHAPYGYSIFTNCSFVASKNKVDCYRGKDCMERFCKDLKEHAKKIINYEKRK